jgi:serine/threonine protein kinase
VTWLSDGAVEHLRDVADWPVIPGHRYEIAEPLGRGGMGIVYRGMDRALNRQVAIKVLSVTAIGPDLAARMRQEAAVLATLEHPGIVPVYDIGLLEDGRLFYVMKLVQGPRLDEHAASRPLTERLRLFTRICDAVAFAHARGVVHRDLKPENVMLGPFGEVLVMDWGVAQVECGPTAENAGSRTSIVGTRDYMAPEQARGGCVDARADVYALGGLLEFLLTGSAPAGEPRGPRALRAICRKARSPEAELRYPDVSSIAADVERFLAAEPVTARREDALDRVMRVVRKHRAAILMITVYLVLRVLIAWLAP